MIPECEVAHALSTRAQVEDEHKERQALINEILILKKTLRMLKCERTAQNVQVPKKN